MNITETLQNPSQAAGLIGATPATAKGKSGTGDFAAALAARTGETQDQRHKQMQQVAGDLVSQALILPILKQLRRSPWGENSIFGGGTAEKTFGPEFDMQIADRLAHSPTMAATAAITRRLESYGKPAAQMTQETKGLDLHG